MKAKRFRLVQDTSDLILLILFPFFVCSENLLLSFPSVLADILKNIFTVLST